MSRLLVVDASVVLAWVFREPDHERATEVLDQWVCGRVDLLAPRILIEEIASVLCKRVRRKHIMQMEAVEAFTILAGNPPRLVDNDIPGALQLGLRHGISFWDGLYLALAIDRRCDFVTADKRLYAAASRMYPHTRHLAA